MHLFNAMSFWDVKLQLREIMLQFYMVTIKGGGGFKVITMLNNVAVV